MEKAIDLIILNKCNETYSLIQQQDKNIKQINELLVEYVKNNRSFSDGEIIVVCYKDTDQEIGKGIVGSAKSCLRLDAYSLRDYSTGKLNFTEELTTIRYEIFAIKKDGTKSSKHLFESPHYISGEKNKYSDIYIKKLK